MSVVNVQWVKKFLRVLPAAGFALAAGCMTVGPDYKKPDIQTASAWHTELQSGVTGVPVSPEGVSRWWILLNDPVLSALIGQAQTNNPDVRQAEARLRAARAERGAAKADLFPTVSISASATRSHSDPPDGESSTANVFANGLDASWELDLFGKKRRTLEAADASLAASQEDLADVLVTLSAEVALNYVDLRKAQRVLLLTESNLALRAESCAITQWRREAGLTTALDVEQARLSLEQARAEIPSLKTAVEEAKNRLAVLLGLNPGQLHERLEPYRPLPVLPRELAVGVPADALRRRPDVRSAERSLAAQTARIGVAEAARWPDLSLAGSIGLDSLSLDDLYFDGTRTARGAVNAVWTLFDFGRVRRNVDIQTARQEEALSVYEAAILTALEDVENALVAYSQEQERHHSLTIAAAAAQTAFELARYQYESGLVDFQTVLDMQRSLLSAQDLLAASDGELIANLVRLYKALGGGWAVPPMPGQTEQPRDAGE